MNYHFFAVDKLVLEDLTFQNGFDFLKMDDFLTAVVNLGCWISSALLFILELVIIELPSTTEDTLSSSSLWYCTLVYFVKCPEYVEEFLSYSNTVRPKSPSNLFLATYVYMKYSHIVIAMESGLIFVVYFTTIKILLRIVLGGANFNVQWDYNHECFTTKYISLFYYH